MATQIQFGTSGWSAVIADLFAKVGSFYPLRENFRLTPEVKEKLTEKLRRDPTEFNGTKVASAVRTDGLKLLPRRRVVGLLSAFGHGVSGARVQRSAQPGRPGKVERSGKEMDLRLGPPSRPRIIPPSDVPRTDVPRSEDGFRSVLGQAVDNAMSQAKDRAKCQAPRAEEAVVRLAERTRPAWSWLAIEWRRLGTAAAIVLIVGLLLHAMFGANGMVVYRQKRAELQSLRNEVDRLQKENDQYVDEIKSLKSDPAAIEKEAREQLHYTRPGEVVYVAPDPPAKAPVARAKNGK